jgi:hypothetical protein
MLERTRSEFLARSESAPTAQHSLDVGHIPARTSSPPDLGDPASWHDAGAPADHANGAADRVSPVFRAAADALSGQRQPAPAKQERWVWWEDEQVVAVEEQPLTGCWINPSDALVIMQLRPDEDEREPFVVLRPENVPAVIRKMASLVGLSVSLSRMSAPAPTAPASSHTPRPKPNGELNIFGGDR